MPACRAVQRKQHMRRGPLPGGAGPAVQRIQPGGCGSGDAGAVRDQLVRQQRLPHPRLHLRSRCLRRRRRLPLGIMSSFVTILHWWPTVLHLELL